MAGMFDVPVVLISGDKAIAAQAKSSSATSRRRGEGRHRHGREGIHPEKAQALIREKTTAALETPQGFKPLKLAAPYTLDVAFAEEAGARGLLDSRCAAQGRAHRELQGRRRDDADQALPLAKM